MTHYYSVTEVLHQCLVIFMCVFWFLVDSCDSVPFSLSTQALFRVSANKAVPRMHWDSEGFQSIIGLDFLSLQQVVWRYFILAGS